MIAANSVRNTCIENYRAAGKLSDPDMKALNKEGSRTGSTRSSTACSTCPYRPTWGINRVIGVARPEGTGAPNAGVIDPTQSLHESVTQRWDADPTYRPVALRDYFRLVGDPRA